MNNEEDYNLLSFLRSGLPRPGGPVSRLEFEVTGPQYIGACSGFSVIAEVELTRFCVEEYAILLVRAVPVAFGFPGTICGYGDADLVRCDEVEGC